MHKRHTRQTDDVVAIPQASFEREIYMNVPIDVKVHVDDTKDYYLKLCKIRSRQDECGIDN